MDMDWKKKAVSFNFLGMLASLLGATHPLVATTYVTPIIQTEMPKRLPGDVQKHGQGIQIIWTGETAPGRWWYSQPSLRTREGPHQFGRDLQYIQFVTFQVNRK